MTCSESDTPYTLEWKLEGHPESQSDKSPRIPGSDVASLSALDPHAEFLVF